MERASLPSSHAVTLAAPADRAMTNDAPPKRRADERPRRTRWAPSKSTYRLPGIRLFRCAGGFESHLGAVDSSAAAARTPWASATHPVTGCYNRKER
eukprot:scaffold57158_cov31-Tisochrysis_lutea.AAC.5